MWVARDVRRKSVFIKDVSIIKVKELGWVMFSSPFGDEVSAA